MRKRYLPGDPAACEHWGHEAGEWKYSCCACSGLPNGCDNCLVPDVDEYDEALAETIWPTAWGEWPGEHGIYEAVRRVRALMQSAQEAPAIKTTTYRGKA